MPRGYSISVGFGAMHRAAVDVPGREGSKENATAYARLFAGHGYHADLFTGSTASRWAVLARLHETASEATIGDVVAVTFSGSGGRRWSDTGVETFWQCCDGRLTHGDLQRAWSWFEPGVRILIIDDCCYSTLSEWERAARGDDVVGCVAPRHNVGDATLLSLPGAAASCSTDIAATVLCLTACSCPGTESDRCPGGLFTEALLRTWNRGGFRGSYDTFCRRIRQALRGLQTPELVAVGPQAREFEMQRPFAIDPPTRRLCHGWQNQAQAPTRASLHALPRRKRQEARDQAPHQRTGRRDHLT